VACIATATAIAESALTAMITQLRPGVTRRALVAAYLERIAELGAPTPPTEEVVRVPPTHHDGPLAVGDLVILAPNALYAGYEGGLARTWVVGPEPASSAQRDAIVRGRRGLGALVAACVLGATGADLRAAWEATGEPTPDVPLVHGLGIGVESPLIGADTGTAAVLEQGMVLSVSSHVTSPAGACMLRDTVVVSPEGPEVLSRYGHGPAGEEHDVV
jgi:Xaa-Pro aminopeptidase